MSDEAVARSSAVMAAGTLVSRLLGFANRALLTLALGASAANVGANAFAVANTLPNTVYLLVAGGVLNAVLVPQIVRASTDPDGGQAYLDRLVTMGLSVLLVLSVLLTLAARPLVQIYTEGSPDLVGLAVVFAYWCIPQVFFYGAYTLFGQILNARGSFGPYTWAPVANNVVAISGLVVFLAAFGSVALDGPGSWTDARVAVLAGSATLGVLAQAVVLVLPLRRAGFTWRLRWGLRGMGLRTAGTVAAWTFGAIVVGQLAYLAVVRTATRAATEVAGSAVADDTASIAAWSLSFLLFMLPHSILAVSVVTAVFTPLAQAARAGDTAGVRRRTTRTVRVLLVALTLPAAGLVALGPEVVRLLFGSNGVVAGPVVVAMSLALPFFSAGYFLQRVFYAYDDGRTPFLVQGSVAGTWVLGILAVRLALPAQLWVPGIAAAMALAQLLGFALALGLAQRRFGDLDVRGVLWVAARLLLLAAVLVPVARFVAGAVGGGTGSLSEAVLALGTGGGVLVLGYLLGCRVLRVREVAAAAAPLLRQAGRLGNRSSRTR